MQKIDFLNVLILIFNGLRVRIRLLSGNILGSSHCIDELGYLPLDKTGCDLLFQVFSKRYELKSTIITTNKPFKKWGEIFNNDSVVASAIIDRLVHHCEIIKLEGESYRMKDKNKGE